MFGLFKSKKKIEQEQRAQYFYHDCITEIQEYISNCPEPTREDLFRISVSAKITYDLFCNVKEIQPAAREFLRPLITNGLAVLITIDNMEEYAALEEMQAIIKNTFNQLEEHNESELTLPAINRAFIISKLVDFDQIITTNGAKF